jgi:hypothetical protein
VASTPSAATDGATAWFVAVCFLPDQLGDASGMPHFMLGMA